MAQSLLAYAVLLVLSGLPIGASAASSLTDSLGASGATPFQQPSPFDENEAVITPAPADPVAYTLAPGMAAVDFEVAPTGGEVALVVENAAHRQQLAFWQFDAQKFARSIDIPASTRIASLTWHPQGKTLFLLATGTAGSQILKLDALSPHFAPSIIYKSAKPLRRLVVGPRPFDTGDAKLPDYRLFFGEKLPSGGYALRSVSEVGTRLYTVAGPNASLDDPKFSPDFPPNRTAAQSALPVGFHPAGNMLIWENEKKCLQKTAYVLDNWGTTTPLDAPCSSITAYTPNGVATLGWQPKTAGLHLHGLIDKTDRVILDDQTFTSVPSQTPDGRGIVDLTVSGGRTTLHYVPIKVPLSNVVNAWMYLENGADQDRFTRDNGLFRNLADNDQIYQLYDSESYACGGPDSRVPTRPYFVTTDLFWEVYGAAFDGLFIVLERERAMPTFKIFLDAATADLAKNHADTVLAKAFTAAQAVLESHETDNAEARLIIAANGRAQSAILGTLVDYGDFKPRGHYKTDAQRRYFGAMRYLSQIKLSDGDVALLRGLDPGVAKAANDWIGSYKFFIAASRLDLVWDGGQAKSPVASHAGPMGTRIFPLSWAWDNEALDNTIYHDGWPQPEQIAAADGTKRLLPSGLDFAAIAGNGLAYQMLDQTGLLAKYPNLAARIQATRKRFAADAARDTGSLYEKWLGGLAIQWADTVSAPIAGPLWNAKRLQTGLASWATLRHSTILVNDKTDAECGEGGFESVLLRPPRGYVEPDPASFTAIAGLFDATIKLVQASPILTADASGDTRLRDGIVRRLSESRDDALRYGRIAQKELSGEPMTAEDYQAIQYVGGAVEHNFLVFMSLSNPGYALSTPDPMMKVADVAGGSGNQLEASVGRPLEWDQLVPFYGRREIVKGAAYSYYEFTAAASIDDTQWRDGVDKQARPDWVTKFLSDKQLSCPATQP
jgi:hypothetical protein